MLSMRRILFERRGFRGRAGKGAESESRFESIYGRAWHIRARTIDKPLLHFPTTVFSATQALHDFHKYEN